MKRRDRTPPPMSDLLGDLPPIAGGWEVSGDAPPGTPEEPRQKQRQDPVLFDESWLTHPKTKVRGVRVVYDVGGESGVAVRDHPTARRWEVTKHGQLVLLDKRKRQVARYRQFVWREVMAGEIREERP